MSVDAKAAVPEPAPVVGGGRLVLPDLVTLLEARSDFGLRKYGVRLHTENGRDAYVDALQELLDLFVYLHQASMERAAIAEQREEFRRDVNGYAVLLEQAKRELDSEQSTREALERKLYAAQERLSETVAQVTAAQLREASARSHAEDLAIAFAQERNAVRQWRDRAEAAEQRLEDATRKLGEALPAQPVVLSLTGER